MKELEEFLKRGRDQPQSEEVQQFMAKQEFKLIADLIKIEDPYASTAAKVIQVQKQAMDGYFGDLGNIPYLWFWLCQMFMSNNLFSAARIACDEGLRLDPNDTLGWAMRGLIFQKATMETGAIELSILRAKNPKANEVLDFTLELYLGRPAQKSLGILEITREAAESWEKATELEPNMAMFWDSLGDALSLTHDRSPEAEAAYLKAIEVEPKETEYWLTLYKLYLKRKDKNKIKELEKRAKSYKLDLKKAYKESMKKSK